MRSIHETSKPEQALALLLNFILKPPCTAFIVNMYALEVAVGNQRQYINRRLVLSSLAWLAEPRCGRTRRDNEGFSHLQCHLAFSNIRYLASRPITETGQKDSSPCRHYNCMGVWALSRARQDLEEGASAGSMGSQRGRGTCHVPSQNDPRAGQREVLVGAL